MLSTILAMANQMVIGTSFAQVQSLVQMFLHYLVSNCILSVDVCIARNFIVL